MFFKKEVSQQIDGEKMREMESLYLAPNELMDVIMAHYWFLTSQNPMKH